MKLKKIILLSNIILILLMTPFIYSFKGIILQDTSQNINEIIKSRSDLDYLGLYSFTNDSVGSYPADWMIEEPADTIVEVISGLDGHNKVVQLVDNSSTAQPTIYNDFSVNKTSGIVEFWFRAEITDTTYLTLKRADDEVIGFRIYSNTLYGNWGDSNHYIMTMGSNIWYNMRIKWNTGGWILIINGIEEYGSGYSYS
ncbi:MAG: hypothetical protein EU549_04210, partial [Promethearchaeota archaeon]